MQKAEKGDIVKVHYTGKLNDGLIFDSSEEREPLQFKIGANQAIQGFEEEIIGLEAGESAKIKVPSSKGYGKWQEELVCKIPHNRLPDSLKPGIGVKLQTNTPEGKSFIVKIIETSDVDITVDANHELAGRDLNFDISLIEIIDNAIK